MKKFLFVMILLSVFGLPAILAQEEGPARVGLRPDAPEYALHGPYWVGTMEVVINPDSERPLPATIWYPALNPDGVEEDVVYDMGIADLIPEGLAQWHLSEYPGHALLDADASGGPYPLVVWSHGYGGTRYFGAYLLEHLASQGIVVIAPAHVGNNMLTSWGPPEILMAQGGPSAILRTQDVTSAIDYAIGSMSDGPFAGLVDAEHIAVIGYSYGGMTALLEGGAQLDMNVYRAWCDATPAQAERCEVDLSTEGEMATLAGLDAVPERMWPPMNDPRVDAVVAMLPSVNMIGPGGAHSVSVPTLVMNATADSQASPDIEVQPVYQHLAVDKAIVTFIGGEHGVAGGGISGPAHDFPGWQLFVHDPVWNLDRSADLTKHFVTAFLLTQFYGDEAAAAALSADAVQFPGIIYKTTGF